MLTGFCAQESKIFYTESRVLIYLHIAKGHLHGCPLSVSTVGALLFARLQYNVPVAALAARLAYQAPLLCQLMYRATISGTHWF